MPLYRRNDAGSVQGGISALARAKVNLALHVTGQRADGYHLLDSLVVFPDIGDRVTVSPSPVISLAVEGPFAEALAAADAKDNLVVRAARLLACRRKDSESGGAGIRLEKCLPVASGIGGGSADAAATLRLLSRLWDMAPEDADLAALGATLGADVPMCIASRPARVTGIGEAIAPLAALPAFGMALVNPGVAVPTPQVFKALGSRDNPPLPASPQAGFQTLGMLLDWLSSSRNDLEPAATAIAPSIADVLALLRRNEDCLFARMSGSGATCFAITEGFDRAEALAARIAAKKPEWWVAAGSV